MKKFILVTLILLLNINTSVSSQTVDAVSSQDGEFYLTPTRGLAESRLQRELQLPNGPDIYVRVSELYDMPGTISALEPFTKSTEIALAWENNTTSDKLIFVMTFVKGMTVLDMIRQIAERRSERLIVTPNSVTIVSKSKILKQVKYRKKSRGDSKDTDYLVGSLIPSFIYIREPDDGGLESLINAKFESSWRISHDVGTSPYRFKESDEAKKRMIKLNAIGRWVYAEFFDTLGLICDLQWQVDGKAVIVEKFSAPPIPSSNNRNGKTSE